MPPSRKGPEGFESFYASIYGERWEILRVSLSAPVLQVSRINRFSDPAKLMARGETIPRGVLAGAEVLKTKIEPQFDSNSLLDVYIMDAASIFAAAALEVQDGDEVLDLCAAPGGKSLILAERMGETGRLTCNELSDRRRGRLRGVLGDYLPEAILARTNVTGHDGTRWCLHETEAYDRILLDAPCSGERHLINSPEEMKLWSPARSKNLAIRQYSLLASSLAVVRLGGRIVYSTCSISPLENDAVISRLLKKREGEARVVKSEFEIGESTEHGWTILPDQTGYGPIYFSILEKLTVSN